MKQQPYITCRELIDFIADYLDETLPLASRHEFERHLSVCPSCVAYLQGYKEAIRLGRAALMKSDEPADAPESLVLAIRAARAKG